ncbi:MAG: LptF/LptG family permease [Bacteroidales bacterium]|nr:LptF/LptG family permease [Bacteroidales bacterium]
MEGSNGEKIKYKIIKLLRLKIIDIYIIRKFLGTFFLAIALILSIAVVFDISEKIDDFIENGAALKDIIFKYYLNFIPYFAVLFSSLFTFISVIYFTSRLAYNTEIIAILNSGMSFRRLLRPYLISAIVIALFSFLLSDRVIPDANRIKLKFEEQYIHKTPRRFSEKNFHRQIEPGIYVYLENYSTLSKVGYNFALEKFDGNKLVSKLIADQIRWDTVSGKWSLRRYYQRDINGMEEVITTGRSKDTTLNIRPEDFARRTTIVETMSLKELDEFIRQQKMQGESNVKAFQIERHKRIAFPFSTFILTFIGVAVSSRKIRGGIGLQIAIGVIISFSYILFMQFSSQFAIGGLLPVMLAAWIPNILFMIVALILFKMAPK